VNTLYYIQRFGSNAGNWKPDLDRDRNESIRWYESRGTVVFKSIRPSSVPGLVAVAEIGHLSPIPA